MTDPINDPNLPVTTNVSDDQILNFSWWLCMLPFFAAIGFFVWRWWQMKGETQWLMYAAGALIIGLVVTGVIAGAGSAADAEATKGDTTSAK
jgi:hypothetical protein